MMNSIIHIHKQGGAKVDAVRVSAPGDIPEFLKEKEAIELSDDGLLHVTCVEGDEVGPLGSVVGYEESDNTASGYNCWFIGDPATKLDEIDGVFYTKSVEKPPVYAAQLISEEFPKFLEGAEITRNPDGSWTIKTSWGASTGFPGQAYWVLYGTDENGTDANILTKSEKSYRNYIVCDEDGVDIGWLYKIDP